MSAMPFLKAALILPVLLLIAAADAPLEKAATSYVNYSPDTLAPGVVVIPAAEDRGIKGDINAYNAALKNENSKYAAGLTLNLLSAGPRLDGPDSVELGRRLAQKENAFTLTIPYTGARVRGAELRGNNVEWTPLACEQIPHNLPAGQYTLTVVWQCSDKPAPGHKRPADLLQQTKFEITPK